MNTKANSYLTLTDYRHLRMLVSKNRYSDEDYRRQIIKILTRYIKQLEQS